jgi:hypothetical protein
MAIDKHNCFVSLGKDEQFDTLRVCEFIKLSPDVQRTFKSMEVQTAHLMDPACLTD